MILNTKFRTIFKNIFDSLFITGSDTSKNKRYAIGDEEHDKSLDKHIMLFKVFIMSLVSYCLPIIFTCEMC